MRLVWHQCRYDLLAFRRNRRARVFTLALPVLFLIIFTGVFGNDRISVHGTKVHASTYYVGGLCALGIISAAFVNLVITLTEQRERGVLKRRRATPMPAWALIVGRSLAAVIVSLASVALVTVVGLVGYDVNLRARTVPALILATVVGAACFCCLAHLLTTFIKSSDAAQPTVQIAVLPLYFISGIFVPASQIPKGLLHVADAMPARPLGVSLLAVFDPSTTGAGIHWGRLGVLVLWGALGLLLALRRFRWTPQGR